MRHPADVALADGDRFGPLAVLHVPGHAADHLVFVAGDAAFTGDAVLGEGSVFIAPDGGSLGGYLDGLRRLRALGLARLCPGHGPEVTDPAAKLDEYIAHRLERERRIVAALESGARTEEELLAAAWDGIPAGLELPARWTLRAHLDKLRADGVRRPLTRFASARRAPGADRRPRAAAARAPAPRRAGSSSRRRPARRSCAACRRSRPPGARARSAS